jgi:hypothetical protein
VNPGDWRFGVSEAASRTHGTLLQSADEEFAEIRAMKPQTIEAWSTSQDENSVT